MKRLTLVTLTTLSISAIAQPTLITQVQENETWIKGGYSTISADSDLTRKSDKATGSESSDTDLYGVSVLKMMQASSGITPGLLLSVNAIEDNGTSLTIVDIAGVARLNIGSLPAAISLGYSATSRSEYRDSVTLSTVLGSSLNSGMFYNQLYIEYQSFIDSDGINGANPLSVTNVSSFRLSPMIAAVTDVDLTIRNDVTVDGIKAIEYGNELTFGVGLDLHVNSINTVQVRVLKSSVINDVYNDGQVIESDDSDTIISLSLVGRF